MAYRNAEARLPETFLSKADADAKAVRAFWRGSVIFACVGLLIGARIGYLIAVWWP